MSAQSTPTRHPYDESIAQALSSVRSRSWRDAAERANDRRRAHNASIDGLNQAIVGQSILLEMVSAERVERKDVVVLPDWPQALHPRLVKSVLPVGRGRAQPATRSLLFFGAGRGRGKRLLRNPGSDLGPWRKLEHVKGKSVRWFREITPRDKRKHSRKIRECFVS